ncbi:peroxidasin [Frankliniella occidentalis]|uniref:Peroxidasin n=1 Tax=Frankliniella occidentalis TaxID=133901 RepID=A0A9C6WMM7_FRAOC|nr:peroxidasin [Frankliniella occidentalis]
MAATWRTPLATCVLLLAAAALSASGDASTAPPTVPTESATAAVSSAATAAASTITTAAVPAAAAATAAGPVPAGGHGHRAWSGAGHAAKHCPNRCVCFKTTVRCMFLQLDHVPRVPPDTTILDLRFNKIRDIPANTFKDMKNLHTLLLNNNHLVRLQNGMFNGLSELRYMFLYKNRIREIDSKVFRGVPKLEQLYLHYNELEKIAPDTFSAMPSLQRLYLHFNKIDRIPGLAFLELRNLERLFLHNNKLRTIPPSAFRNLQSLKRIRLDNNWLVCDCNALWLARLLRERGVQGAATCASPPQLQGRPVAELRESDFHCSKPRIVKEPDDVELDYVGPVYFKCQAEGDPQPRIVWLKEGQEEMNPGEPGYEFMSDGTLMVEAPSMDPVGAYACVAKSAMGEAKSRVARLVTNKRRERPDISRPPRDWQVAPGDTVTLDCRAVGTPPPLVSWTHNGRPVAHSPRSLIATDGTLVLTGLRADEAGEYRCTASNAVGSTSASARVTINETITIPRVAPRISSRPDNLTVKAGGTVLLRCRVDGSPRPSVAWFKDGRTVTAGSPRTTISNTGEELRVEHAKEADGGLYVCRAENAVGSAETMARVQVVGLGGLQQQGPRPRGRVRLVHHPFNMEAMVGTSVEIPCSAEADNGQPLLSWRKDGQSVTLGPRLRVGRVGSLRIYNVTLEDAGLYECIATDGAEEVSAKGLLAVRGDVPAPGSGPFAAPGDQFVRQAFGEASLAVDRAVNATLRAFQQAERNHATLYRAIRFPDASARDVARAADVFEKTLINIRRHVEAGSKMNVTQDFNYTELLSPKQLQLVANLSGCMAHRPTVDCSDMCFHLKYRTVDGTCNNLQHPMWGASLTGFRRVLRPQYENGLSTPIGWNKNVKYFGYPKPSARLVSTSIIKTEAITPDPSITHMVMQWGQFLDHDLDHAIPSETSTSWDGIDCKKSCDYAAPCYPIEVPPNDPRVNNRRCIDFIRSSAICGSGQTSVLFDGMQPREQINQLTSFVDASQVYGFSDEQARGLRNLTNEWGRLREGAAYQFSDKPYLPFPNPGEAMDCRR